MSLQTKGLFFIALQNCTVNLQPLKIYPTAQCDSRQFCRLSGNLKTQVKQRFFFICDENKRKVLKFDCNKAKITFLSVATLLQKHF